MHGPLELPSIPDVKWHFVGQASELVTIEGSPPDPDVVGCTIVRMKADGTILANDRPSKIRDDGPGTIWHETDQNHWNFNFANFSTGVGYAFLSEDLRNGCFAFSP
jgi:hypothetical protein